MRKHKILSILLCMAMMFNSTNAVFADQLIYETEEEVLIEDDNSSFSANSVEEIPADEEYGVYTDAVIETMGLHGITLNAKMRQDKEELIAQVNALKGAVPGEDYLTDEIVAQADTRQQALMIADCYNGELLEYSYGIATIKVDNGIDVFTIEKISADMANTLPAVYPNIIYRIAEAPVEEDSVFETTLTSGGVIYEALSWNKAELNLGNDSDTIYGWKNKFIDLESAQKISKGEGIKVAVIDTGVDGFHEEFSGKIFGGYQAEEGYGYYDEEGRLVYEKKPYNYDGNGHGTHVAGIIAAVAGNGVGIKGIAPEAKIFSGKCFGTYGNGTTDIVTRAIVASQEADVDVINMSLGGNVDDLLNHKACKEAYDKGIVMVVAAGNDITDGYDYPAAYKETISVGALEKTKDGYIMSDFSNYGSTVDIAAPGTKIFSTLPGYSILFKDTFGGIPGMDETGEGVSWYEDSVSGKLYRNLYENYGFLNGTSQAAPVVAGVVALILSSHPELKENSSANVEKVRNILKESAKDVTYTRHGWTSGNAGDYGVGLYGGVDAYQALLVAGFDGKVEKPVINTVKNEGKTYLTITSETDYAKIYYSLDGTTPESTEEYLYNRPVCLDDYDDASGIINVKALAVVGTKKSSMVTKKVAAEVIATSLSVNNGRDIYILPGKKVELVANILPVAAEKMPEYSIAGDENFTLKNGIVTCGKNAAPGSYAVVTAKLNDGSNLSSSIKIIATSEMAAGIELTKTELTMVTMESASTAANSAYRVVDVLDLIKDGDVSANYIVKSSNASVKVVSNRYLVAKKKGKSTITITANDGSNIKAKCKVSVVVPVVELRAVKTDTGFLTADAKTVNISKSVISGNVVIDLDSQRVTNDESVILAAVDDAESEKGGCIPIAIGGKIKLTTYLNNDNRWKNKKLKVNKNYIPTNKKVKITCNDSGITIKGNTIICNENAKVGSFVTVTVQAEDGFGAKRDILFRIWNNPGKVEFDEVGKQGAVIDFNDDADDPLNESGIHYMANDKGDTKPAYKPGITDHIKTNENTYPFYLVSGVPNAKFKRIWAYGQVSPDDVGRHDYWSYVPVDEGNATISFKTKDGTNRKVNYKIKVTNIEPEE